MHLIDNYRIIKIIRKCKSLQNIITTRSSIILEFNQKVATKHSQKKILIKVKAYDLD